MSHDNSQKPTKRLIRVSLIVGSLLAIVVVAVASKGRWLPLLQHARLNGHVEDSTPSGGHEDHDHDHAGHNEAASIEVSEKGLKNIVFEPFTVVASRYDKTLTLPAIVVERPGRSQLHITAPLTAIVTDIYAVTGEAVEPEQPLFELQLTHEDLVSAQREYLRTAESLDVVNREFARLRSLGEGVIAGRRIL